MTPTQRKALRDDALQYLLDCENGVLVDAVTTDSLVRRTLDLASGYETPDAVHGGKKNDQTKPDYSLLSPIAITYLVQVLDFGAKKYSAHNWRDGLDQTRLISAALRHLFAFLSGQDNDTETGLPHMSHVMCCAMFSVELQESLHNKDSRYPFPAELVSKLESLLAGK